MKWPALLWLSLCLLPFTLQAIAASNPGVGERFSGNVSGLTAWWTPSTASKIQPQSAPPTQTGRAMVLSGARHEREAVQFVFRSQAPLTGLRLSIDSLVGPDKAELPARHLELFQAQYLEVTRPSDASSKPGWYPDPLLPVTGPLDLGANTNHAFWVRVHIPKIARPGLYKGAVRLQSPSLDLALPLELTVYDFTLPERMTCTTAFGFSPGEVFRYHKLKTDDHKRLVLDKYLANLAAHHISPYNPAPLDPIQVKWPDVRPPKSSWDHWVGLRIVSNEVHSGRSALLVHDDQPGLNVTVQYEPLIPIPPGGLRFRGWYRTAVPNHRFLISFNHHDAQREWMSGCNNDLTLVGDGTWQPIDLALTNFPPGAAFVRFHLRATVWTDAGEKLGLVWFDDLSLKATGQEAELLPGGDFERQPRTQPIATPEQLQVQLDFTQWDRAMDKAVNHYQFNSFQVDVPGLGGGTFHEIDPPNLLGFVESDPEYPLLFASYARQLEAHLRQRGWLDRAFVYWFDEPSPDQYPFVLNGFAKLKRYCPGITRMLTEQVEPGLIGGPNLWCPISNEYQHDPAQARRAEGEKFWWYVCTGPKAPYAGLFIDHPAPEMRLWVWQTWQHGIEGLLVWQINYWTSHAAYPDSAKPQNPFQDPMSWMSGYSTPAGKQIPWGNGDGRFIYPPLSALGGDAPVLDGPIDSIRWEHLRDGIEDYEYFCILRDRLSTAQLSAAEKQSYARLLQVPETVSRTLTQFAPDGSALEQHRRALAEAIVRLTPGR